MSWYDEYTINGYQFTLSIDGVTINPKNFDPSDPMAIVALKYACELHLEIADTRNRECQTGRPSGKPSPKSNARYIPVIAGRDGWKCHYCGTWLESPKSDLSNRSVMATIDHKVPQSKGGMDDPDNLVLACQSCNSAKGSKDYVQFVQSRRHE